MNPLTIFLPILVKAMADPATMGFIMKLIGMLGQGGAQSQQQVPSTPEPGPFDMLWVQKALNKVMGTNIPLTGRSDEATRVVVEQYQRKTKDTFGTPLVPDGWPGLKTIPALYRDYEAALAQGK